MDVGTSLIGGNPSFAVGKPGGRIDQKQERQNGNKRRLVMSAGLRIKASFEPIKRVLAEKNGRNASG